MRTIVAAILLAAALPAAGQIHITKTETVPLPASQRWMAPGWSPQGRVFFITSMDYSGLWSFDLNSGAFAQITADPGAGYGWTVSPDGAHLAYRKTTGDAVGQPRSQEIVDFDLTTGASATVKTAQSVDLPVYSGEALLVNAEQLGVAVLGSGELVPGAATVLGIENTKIALMKGGQKSLLDPFGDGSYIWPSLSPDGKRLLAYDMTRGAFVCDLEGNVLARLGRLDAPGWTRSGSWIISMREENDGQVITGSDLYATTPDGLTNVRLTRTPVIELSPSCSPVDNRILCATADGTILVLTYEEAGQ
jgi:Tol biopolymer transport system component